MTLKELRQKVADLVAEARKLHTDAGEADLTEDQQKRFDEIDTEIDALNARIDREEKLQERENKLNEPLPVPAPGVPDNKTDIRVGEDRSEKRVLAKHTLGLLNSIRTGNFGAVERDLDALVKGGFYGSELQQRAAGDYYSTLVSADGAILLPTTVVNEIETIGDVVGVARQLVTTFSHVVGTLRVPGATGDMTASAVAEGGEIASKMRQFQAVELNPKKWALIVPWTYEINEEAAPLILQDALQAIGQGFARGEDGALFNGDGSSTYNSIHGIFSAARTSVATYSLPSTKTAFTDLTADDIFLMRNQIPASLRAQAVYVFHPDMESHLRTLKDGDGRYLYAFNDAGQVSRLGGKPVYYTEVLPDASDTAAGKNFGVFGAFKAMKMAHGPGITSENLREATVKDADSGAAINLATMDLQAIKMRNFFDMDANFDEAFCKIKTADS